MPKSKSTIRNLVIVLGDQLDRESVVFDDFDQHQDAVWMAEVKTESTHVWSHRARIAVFLSAMRHFRNELLDKEYVVHYRELGDPNNCHTLGGELSKTLKEIQVEKILCVPPGDFRVWKELKAVITELSVPVDWVTDRHFLCTTEELQNMHAGGNNFAWNIFIEKCGRSTRS
ncbi:MAG: cryptochrome/photolyase family protein [Zavarzinella sp.]